MVKKLKLFVIMENVWFLELMMLAWPFVEKQNALVKMKMKEVKNALLQHQKINHAVTKKLKNVERMKGIVIRTVIAKPVSSVALIIVQVVSHRTMTAVIMHHHHQVHHQVHLMSNALTITRYFNMIISYP